MVSWALLVKLKTLPVAPLAPVPLALPMVIAPPPKSQLTLLAMVTRLFEELLPPTKSGPVNSCAPLVASSVAKLAPLVPTITAAPLVSDPPKNSSMPPLTMVWPV